MPDATLTDFAAPTSSPSVTMVWNPDGQQCDRCDTTVTRCWQATDGTELVCPGCKSW